MPGHLRVQVKEDGTLYVGLFHLSLIKMENSNDVPKANSQSGVS